MVSRWLTSLTRDQRTGSVKSLSRSILGAAHASALNLSRSESWPSRRSRKDQSLRSHWTAGFSRESTSSSDVSCDGDVGVDAVELPLLAVHPRYWYASRRWPFFQVEWSKPHLVRS